MHSLGCEMSLPDVTTDLSTLSLLLLLFTWSVMSNSFRPMDYSPPGLYVHGILQARILK